MKGKVYKVPETTLKSATNRQRLQAVTAPEAFAVRRALTRSVTSVGERLLKNEKGAGEFNSLDKSHLSSRNVEDLETS
jgi:hypothetical protein